MAIRPFDIADCSLSVGSFGGPTRARRRAKIKQNGRPIPPYPSLPSADTRMHPMKQRKRCEYRDCDYRRANVDPEETSQEFRVLAEKSAQRSG